jgi:hypothetical protein
LLLLACDPVMLPISPILIGEPVGAGAELVNTCEGVVDDEDPDLELPPHAVTPTVVATTTAKQPTHDFLVLALINALTS